jgi:DNA-binding NarL/FixJ family response regulator
MDGMPIRLLIVDDHPGFRARARALLEADGFEVVGEARDGESALAATRAMKPEVILLDIQLPDIDGFEVAARLRADGHSPTIVLTSSRDISEYGNLVMSSGAAGFVAKAELSGTTLGALLE